MVGAQLALQITVAHAKSATTRQLSGDAFNFQRQYKPQRATRGWDRVPKSPFKPHPKGRKVWKRYDLRSRPQGSTAEPAVSVDTEEEAGVSEVDNDVYAPSARAVKRRCLDSVHGEELEGGGLGKAGNYVGTLWEKSVDFLKRKTAQIILSSDTGSIPLPCVRLRSASPADAPFDIGKLAQSTSTEPLDACIDPEGNGALSSLPETEEHSAYSPNNEVCSHEALADDLPILWGTLPKTQYVLESSSPLRRQVLPVDPNETDCDMVGDRTSASLERSPSEESTPHQHDVSEQSPIRIPEVNEHDEASTRSLKTVDAHVLEKLAPAVTDETITQEVHHVRDEIFTREIRYHDRYHHIQPAIDVEGLPTKHYVQADDGRLMEVSSDRLPGRQKNWDMLATTADISSVTEHTNNLEPDPSTWESLLETDIVEPTSFDVNEAAKNLSAPISAEAWKEATIVEKPDAELIENVLGANVARNVPTSQGARDEHKSASETYTVEPDTALPSPQDTISEFRETDHLNPLPKDLQPTITEEQRESDDASFSNHSAVEPALIADNPASYDEILDLQHDSNTPNYAYFEENHENTEVFSDLELMNEGDVPSAQHKESPNNTLNRAADDTFNKASHLETTNDENLRTTAPSTPPPSDPANPLEGRMYKTRLSDTTMLKDFLSRAKARKEAAKLTSTTSPIPKPRASPPKSPRIVLADLDTNPPSPNKNRAIAERSGTPPPAPGMADQVGLKEGTISCRRSARTRTPVTPSQKAIVPVGAPSFIPVRRADGAEPVVLQKSEAQELAVLTKQNTRRNKGSAKLPKITIESIMDVELAEVVLSDPEVAVVKKGKKRKVDKDGKVVSWDEQLVYYREMDEDEEEDEERGRSAAKRVGGLKAGNGTPAPKRARTIENLGGSVEDGKPTTSSRIATPASTKTIDRGKEVVMRERKSRIGTPAPKKDRGTRNATPAPKRMADVLGEEHTPALKRRGRIRV
ncbi:MAG: hypothetical protein M1835_007879 [Candelina submexicana]|nr:MAG: hypothetical protein M1835_007879 [Candelina submexicana]